MSVLVMRHEVWEHLGLFEGVLDQLGFTFKYHDLGDPFETENHDALVVLGGPMSANDRELENELKAVEKAIGSGIPVLGVCLGSQLIAKALGARVYRNGGVELGWAPVHLTKAGMNDPVFQGTRSPETVFHWHGETFDLPEGAEWLAWSERTRHQAFRYGDRVYGLQFHPEVTAEMIEDWSSQPVNCGDVATLSEPVNARAFDQAELAERIVRGWLGAALAGQ